MEQVAYGRGVVQDYRDAYVLFQEAAALNHAPASYYCGIFALYGHGVPIDYNQALGWFEQAAGMEDPTISAKVGLLAITLPSPLINYQCWPITMRGWAQQAAAARDELSESLLRAKEVNTAVQEAYSAVEEQGDHGGDESSGGSGGSWYLEAEAALAEVDEEIRRAGGTPLEDDHYTDHIEY